MKRLLKVLLLGIVMVLATSCGTLDKIDNNYEVEDSGFLKVKKGNYDSVDTAIVVKNNVEECKITLRNIEVARDYTLSYTMETSWTGDNEELVTPAQIEVGDIVDVTFLRMQKWLNTLKKTDTDWEYSNVSNYEIDENYTSVTIAEDVYELYEVPVVSVDNKEVSLLDIHSMDIVGFRGIDNKIYSIIVETGHGYIRLENDENFAGGWIEVGKSIIQRITPGMLLTVPEGKHEVCVSNAGVSGNISVVVGHNEEVSVDVSKLTDVLVKRGNLIFSINPPDATVKINEEVVDTDEVLNYEYGVYKLLVEAEGYIPISKFIKVAEANASVEIEMDELTEEDEALDSDKDEVIDPSQLGYMVKIQAPEGVQVYADGIYVGVTPTQFPKVPGTKVLTLKKEGYENRIITIDINDEKKDIVYSFSELTKNNN